MESSLVAAAPHLDCLKLVLSSGAKFSPASLQRALSGAVKEPDCVRPLIASGADMSTSKGVLWLAVGEGPVESVNLLLNSGSSPDDFGGHFDHTGLTTAVRDDLLDMLSLFALARRKPEFPRTWTSNRRSSGKADNCDVKDADRRGAKKM